MMPPQGLSPTSLIVRMRSLRDRRDGTVAMMFGLLLLPTLVTVGAAVDVARAYSAKMRFDAAFDNATMALRASAASETAQTLQARMQSYLDLANPSLARGGHVTLRMSDPLNRVVVVTAATAVPTVLMQLAGVTSLPLHAAAQIVRQHPPVNQVTPGNEGGGDSGEENRRQLEQRGARSGLWLRQNY
jgi:Flp pilus assembly protein TadG